MSAEIFDAIKEGNAGRVLELIEQSEGWRTASQDGISPLMMALYYGKSDIAQSLLEHDLSPSFHEACAVGRLDLVTRAAAANPAVVNARSADGFTALGLAIFFGQTPVARFLLDQGAEVNAQATNGQRVGAIHAAVSRKDRDMVSLLLGKGADPNLRQERGFTPLHGAAASGEKAIAELLLLHGADRTLLTEDGKSPADLARERGHAELADWMDNA